MSFFYINSVGVGGVIPHLFCCGGGRYKQSDKKEGRISMEQVVQKIKVVASDKDGMAVVIQSIPMVSTREYRYEVEIGMVEQLVDELDRQFKDSVKSILDAMSNMVDSQGNDDDDNDKGNDNDE